MTVETRRLVVRSCIVGCVGGLLLASGAWTFAVGLLVVHAWAEFPRAGE